MLFGQKSGERHLQLFLREKQIPTRLQKDIRLLASKNIMSKPLVSPSRPKTILFETSA
jgi:hypothetical protein